MVDIVPIEQIVSKIYWLRGVKVLLDRDLATLYDVETRILKRNVRRHIKRFPDDFMFELSYQEFAGLRSQFGISNRKIGESYKIITFMFEYTVIKAYATPSSHRCTRSLASYYRSWN